MRFSMLLPILLGSLSSAEPPAWVLQGILYTETRSTFNADGSIRYVDKRRGSHGERGAFQMTRIAFEQVKARGEQFWMIEKDPRLAEDLARRYLSWLYDNSGKQNWYDVIEKYNAGPGGRSRVYLGKVLRFADSTPVL
jgi:hypothetical protein